MARLHHAINPAKVKHQVQALDNAAPAAAPGQPRRSPALPAALAMLLITPAMLLASFAPFDLWPLAYGALAPWTLGLALWQRNRWPVVVAWAGGLLFAAASVYWLYWVTLEGYLGAVFYLSLYWLVAAAVLRAAMRRRWPIWLVLPTVWVSLEFARSYVISGFPWFFLAQSQYLNTQLIQIADVTGQYGVSFFVAMVNGLLVDAALWLVRDRVAAPAARPSLRLRVAGAAAVAIACIAMNVYGAWRLGQPAQTPGPVLGLVQESFPIALGVPSPPQDKILQRHMELASRLEGKDCDLVILPESMLPTGLNAQHMGICQTRLSILREQVHRTGPDRPRGEDLELRLETIQFLEGLEAQSQQVQAMSHRLGCPILGGGTAVEFEDREPLFYNSALWFDANGCLADYYAKIHLVPFSEYVPFKHGWPWLHHALRSFVPSVMSQLEPGRSYRQFSLAPRAGAGTPWQLATPICYEGTFDYECRKLVAAGPRKADVLVNLSNDGWFIWQRGGQRLRSTEHAQHLAHYCFRAIENRVPVVRAVNTGITASVDSCGRIVSQLSANNARTMIAGVLLLDGKPDAGDSVQHGPRVLVDSRATVYSLAGDVFAWVVSLAAAVLVAVLARRPKAKE